MDVKSTSQEGTHACYYLLVPKPMVEWTICSREESVAVTLLMDIASNCLLNTYAYAFRLVSSYSSSDKFLVASDGH